MSHQKFDIAKLDRLNDEGRFDTLKPDVMWAALAVPEPRVLAEIGAGTGLFSAVFSRLAPGCTVYAVDTEDAMLEWMQANRPEVANGRIVPVKSAEGAVPLADGIADAVVMINLHHELAEPDAIYAESHRLLRPGGRLLVVDWAPIETPKGPPLAIRATGEELRVLLEQAGFTDAVVHEGALPWHTLVTAGRAG